MIFRRISHSLALQFTGFVVALLLLAGIVFIAGDIAQRNRDAHMRLERQLELILSRPAGSRGIPDLPQFQRERIRITDKLGRTIFAGSLYSDIPFSSKRGLSTVDRGRESYDILTAPFVESGEIVGYLQVADLSERNDLQTRLFLYLLVCACITAVAYGVGRFFAHRSLQPAQNMMDRLEQFTQDASHELRTPLTAVGTSLDLALATEENKDLVRAAKRDLKDMATLVERLLELARLDTFVVQKEPVDLSALVPAVLDTHESQAKEKGVTIMRSIAKGVIKDADASMARQVVSNIVGNAIKFNKPGGVVTVTLAKDALLIHDNGPGISPDALPKIFDRFYRADDARSKASEGLGLGLSLVKRIVDVHGWTVKAESTPAKGTLFVVKF